MIGHALYKGQSFRITGDASPRQNDIHSQLRTAKLSERPK